MSAKENYIGLVESLVLENSFRPAGVLLLNNPSSCAWLCPQYTAIWPGLSIFRFLFTTANEFGGPMALLNGTKPY